MTPVRSRIGFILRLLVGTVFVVSGLLKLENPERFLYDIQRFDLVPYLLAYLAALWIPAIELLAGVGLILKRLYRGALIWLGILVCTFTGAIALSYNSNVTLDCGCFLVDG